MSRKLAQYFLSFGIGCSAAALFARCLCKQESKQPWKEAFFKNSGGHLSILLLATASVLKQSRLISF